MFFFFLKGCFSRKGREGKVKVFCKFKRIYDKFFVNVLVVLGEYFLFVKCF